MEPDDASSAEMRREHPDPPALDEETVERLLAGDLPPAAAPPGYAEVAALLEAAGAPPAPEELAGEQAVLAELRAVTRARAAATATRPVASSRRRRRVGLAAVAVVGALVTGGAAGAATGHLPAPVRDAARTIVDAVGGGEPATTAPPGAPPASATPNSASGGVGRAGQGEVSTGSTGRRAGLAGPGSVAGSDLKGLCRAYVAGKGDEQGKKLDAAAFEALAGAAGGADRIAAWCQEANAGGPENPGGGHGQQQPPEEKPKGGPPPNSGQGNPGGNGSPPNSNGVNPGQGPPVTQPPGG
jgi:hypothetical protein